ncbi:MAG: hypothetical protein HYR62_08140 [Actinobacteria bacterium]|nr:hypothetical protein [Actinomycetota bacterium]MBI3688057.1 hypothetical protein [Actinomycetota bacterium]
MDIEVGWVDNAERVLLGLTREELYLIAGSVNEAIEAVEDWEFSTRLGVEKKAARKLRADLRAAIQELPPPG